MENNLTAQRDQLREYFDCGKTRSWEARIRALKCLEQSINSHKEEVEKALKEDLGKSTYEAFMTEIGLALGEIAFIKKHLKGLMKPKRKRTALTQFPGKAFVQPQPYGVALIMSPWNYPFLLSLAPLVGAIAAGNTVMLKPSAYAPATADILKIIINELPQGLAFCALGGRESNRLLLDMSFDYIFFTGSPIVGREVVKASMRDLTPYTLELGGKSPCVVDETVDIAKTAKRLLFGKLLNAGQTCIAPDYLLVQSSVKSQLVEELIKQHKNMLSETYAQSHWGHIINDKHFARLEGYLEGQNLLLEGSRNPDTRKFGFTLIDEPLRDSLVMQEEIFGPILPIISFDKFNEIVKDLRELPNPLAMYLFSKDKEHMRIVQEEILFGGGCINDTLLHISSPHLPFGGVGNSGVGRYHGKASFETFSHLKSMLKKSWIIDVPVRYHPYKNPDGRPPEFFF